MENIFHQRIWEVCINNALTFERLHVFFYTHTHTRAHTRNEMTNDHRRVFLLRVVSLSPPLSFFLFSSRTDPRVIIFIRPSLRTGNPAPLTVSFNYLHFAYSFSLSFATGATSREKEKEKLLEILPSIFRPHRNRARETSSEERMLFLEAAVCSYFGRVFVSEATRDPRRERRHFSPGSRLDFEEDLIAVLF